MTQIKTRHSFDEVSDAQQVFRLILTAVSNPGRIVNIRPSADKLYGDERPLLAVAMTLLDNEVSFNVCGSQELSDEIISLTLSRKEKLEDADYIFVTDPARLEGAITGAKCGTLQDPHKSATLIVKVDGEGSGSTAAGRGAAAGTCGQDDGGEGLSADDGGKTCVLRLSGPGIKGTVEFPVAELVKTALDIRDGQFYEYPQGTDMIFISNDGDLFAVPRLTRKEAS